MGGLNDAGLFPSANGCATMARRIRNWDALVMFTDPKIWRKQVENRIVELTQEINFLPQGSLDHAKVEHRIRMLREELSRLDEEDEQRGTQWMDPDTGAAADM